MTVSDFLAILPLIVLVAWATLLILVDLFIPGERKVWTVILATIGLFVALGLSLAQMGQEYVAFGGMVVVDGYASYLNVLFVGAGLVAIALAYDYIERMGINRSEYYILLMYSISGMMLMAIAADLIVVFLALELLSIPLYILAGFARPRLDSEEAAMKYFLLGAFAAGFLVYGVALIFGATGTTSLAGIVQQVSAGVVDLFLLTIGAAFILIGLGFKVAAVPFHMWTPDVYHGAPSSVTAFMAVGAKAAGFAAMIRVFFVAFSEVAIDLTPVLWVVAVLTMVLGNVVAIAQRNIKRMLAYSSIAHAGFILMALVPYGQQDIAPDAVAAALFYLLAYAFTNLGAWAVVIALEKVEGKGLELEDYAGLGRKYPLLGVAMTIFMLSFTGVPPTLGFVGKFYLFSVVVDAGMVWLAIIGVLTSLVSAYYYLRVVVYMYMSEGEPEVRRETWIGLTAAVTAVAVVVLSIFSEPLLTWASEAALLMF
ncbi:MAG: NADH-quinone oxidoreductase subunit N [Anaerolineales bacterium]|jgi:NADH-quinone oxidoreductase subunit N